MSTPILASTNYLSMPSSPFTCASGAYPIKLVDLLLAAHSRVSKREVDFTILILDAIIYAASDPYASIPIYLLDKALDAPDLVHALATSPHLDLGVGEGSIGHVFPHLVRRLALRYCYRERAFTSSSYQEAIEYLTQQPFELALKHEQYRADLVRREQAKKVAAKTNKRKAKGQAAAMIVLSIFMTKKEWREAKMKVRARVGAHGTS
ncbi:hypothetical protein FRC12_020400 [Ceratobasidium sp. 428]|nr:hypothetical protein FRC12_020400 [Ceratobasidium sp. 428]